MSTYKTFYKAQEIFKNQKILKSNTLSNISKKEISRSKGYLKLSASKIYNTYKTNKLISFKTNSFYQKVQKNKTIGKVFFNNSRIVFFFIQLKKLLIGLNFGKSKINQIGKFIYLNLKKEYFHLFFSIKFLLRLKVKKITSNTINKYLNINLFIELFNDYKNFCKQIVTDKLIQLNTKNLKKNLLSLKERLINIGLFYIFPFCVLLIRFLSNIPNLKGRIFNLDLNLFVETSNESLNRLAGPVLFLYYALFFTHKNPLKLSKKTRYNGVFTGACFLIDFGLTLFNYIVNKLFTSYILFEDLSFMAFLLKNKKVMLLRQFTSIVSGEMDVSLYSIARVFENLSYELGEYEEFVETLRHQFFNFVCQSGLAPIYLILLLALLYNCIYYIVFDKYPYIPCLTELINRQMPKI